MKKLLFAKKMIEAVCNQIENQVSMPMWTSRWKVTAS
jgi:hypothetical protein